MKTARHGATSSEPVNLRPHYVSYDDFTHDLEICSLDAEFAVHLCFVNGGSQIAGEGSTVLVLVVVPGDLDTVVPSVRRKC